MKNSILGIVALCALIFTAVGCVSTTTVETYPPGGIPFETKEPRTMNR